MRTMRLFLILALGAALCHGVVFAEERVAKATIRDNKPPPFDPHNPAPPLQDAPTTKITSSYELPGFLPAARAEVDSLTFTVYTKQEIDSKLAQDARQISELQDLITMLRQNLKNLADINDALSKRVDELETRLNQH